MNEENRKYPEISTVEWTEADDFLENLHEVDEEVMREIATRCAETTINKNKSYGSSVATSKYALMLLFPNGIPIEKYEDVSLLTRAWDKMMRIANDKGAFDESPYVDLVGYSLIGAEKDENK